MVIIVTVKEVVILKLTVTGAIIWGMMVVISSDGDNNYGHK